MALPFGTCGNMNPHRIGTKAVGSRLALMEDFSPSWLIGTCFEPSLVETGWLISSWRGDESLKHLWGLSPSGEDLIPSCSSVVVCRAHLVLEASL